MGEELEAAAEIAAEIVGEELAEAGHPAAKRVAIATMIMGLIAAVGGLLAGMTSNEVLLTRTEQILEQSNLDGDRVSIDVLRSKSDILISLGKKPNAVDLERIERYDEAVLELEKETAEDEVMTEEALMKHEHFAIGVTLLAIAISMCGMYIVADRKNLWATGITFAIAGTGFVGFGVMKMLGV